METTRIKLNRPGVTVTETDPSPKEAPKPAEAVAPPAPAPRPQKVTRAPKPREGFTPPAQPAAPAPVTFGAAPAAPKTPGKTKGKKGPNVLNVKKVAAELAAKFFPKKHARTTTGSDVQVAEFLFRAAGGSGTPNLLATYRTAMTAVRSFVFDFNREKLHPFGVVAIDTESGRPVVVVDAEFLFRVFSDLGWIRLTELWSVTGPDR